MGPIRPRRSHSIFCFLISFLLGWLFLSRNEPPEMEDIQSAAKWQRELVDQKPQSAPFFGQQAKLDRPRFAHSELGIRQQLLVLLLARSPPIAPSLFGLLSPKVPIRPLIPQSGPIPELPPNAQPISIRPGPVGLLSALANQSLHNSADWFFLLPDSTFLNIFQLQKLLSSLQWNSPQAFGHREGHYCQLEGGILLSAPALHSLVQNRHLCHGLLPNGQNEDSALETCIRLAANLTCEGGIGMDWWRIGAEGALKNGGNNPNNPSTQLETGSIHDQIGRLSLLDGFNSSTTISGLLSQKDVHSLEEHFLRVELAKMEAQIGELEFELGEAGEQIVGWPIGLQIPQKPPNRFQVPVWEMLDAEGKLFGNNPDENFVEEKMEKGEWAELVEEAEMRASNCAEEGGMPKMRQAYRRFSPGRGMDYFVDLECGGKEGKWLERVQLVRPIESTKLVETVPFVKEDRELAILVPVDSAIQVRGIRPLLRRILGICLQQTQLESPKMRILVASRQMDAKLIRLLAADLGEMKRRCHSTLDSTLLLLKPDPFGQIPIQLAALDEAVDRFGPQNLFLLLSPFVDFQPDFLDRTRLNAIRHFQVFFPIPFAEFNQFVAGLTPKEAEQFLVHKSRGRFDPENWEVAALFGADFAWARARHSVLHPSAPSSLLDLFLGQSRLHILRPIEPSLRIRPHPWVCGQQNGREKCERRRRLGLGTRAQLARLVLPPNNAENIGGNRNGQ